MEGDGVAHGHGAKVVQHELDVGRRDVLTDGERLGRLGHAQGSGVVLEERRGAPFLLDGLALRGTGQAPLRRREVERVRDVVGEQHVTSAVSDDR